MQQLPLVVKVMVKICYEQEVATMGSKMWGEAAADLWSVLVRPHKREKKPVMGCYLENTQVGLGLVS